MKCIFCDIISRKTQAEIIWEDEELVCFLDIDPINHGHLLIVPKEHFPNLSDLPDAICARVMLVGKKMAIVLQEIFKADGVTILQNNGYCNDIGHYHMHVIPRYVNDNFKWTFPKIDRSLEKLKEIGLKFREALNITSP